ncbi:hypothetical protein BC940DRAFT_362946 [Gongronella butleri]|nr:hypothetical protein BC940DRAFT_362946 [Gongronella butleri]
MLSSAHKRHQEGDDAEPESSRAAIKRARLQRLQSDDEDDDVDQLEDDNDDDTPNGIATQRSNGAASQPNGNGDHLDLDEDDEEELDQESVLESMNLPPLPVGDDGYVDGSIVRMVLKNFVTYEYCEFSPGPQLNMIIGPNGTGKSTIVCAIALGLGGKSDLLGRSKDPKDFIRTGTDEASIHIELKRVQGRNITVQRNINSNGHSQWKLNGKKKAFFFFSPHAEPADALFFCSHSSQKEIMSKINGLNIQVDNLCQFLPQDRVAEFARLTPPQLLMRTQTAVGEKNMLKWHNALIDMRKDQKALQSSFSSDVEFRQKLEHRLKELEGDVSRIRDRQTLARRIKLLKAKLPLVKYTEVKKEHEIAKEKEVEAGQVKAQYEQEAAPIKNALRRCQNVEMRTQEKITTAKQAVHNNESRIKSKAQEINEAKMTLQRKKNNIEQFHNRQKDLENEIAALRSSIAHAERALPEEPSRDTSALDAELRTIDDKMTEHEFEMQNIRREHGQVANELQASERSLHFKEKEFNEMGEADRAKLANLKKYQFDTYRAMSWIHERRQSFAGRVYKPVQLELKVKDQRYADHIEGTLGGTSGSHLRTFVFEKSEDYKMFMREVVDGMKLRVTAAWPGDIDYDEAIRTPMSETELRDRFKMDHFIINLVEGPRVILAYLCQQVYLHQCPVSLRAQNPKPLVDSGQFGAFMMGRSAYRVRSYSYGRGGAQTTTREILPARILKDQIDEDARRQVRSEIQDLQRAVDRLKEQSKLLAAKQQEIKQKMAEHDHAKSDLVARRRDIHQAHQRWNGQVLKLQRLKQQLVSKESMPASSQGELESLEQQVIDVIRRRAQLVVEYKTAIQDYVKAIGERHIAQIEAMGSTERLNKMQLLERERTQQLKAATLMHERAKQVTKEKRAAARHFQQQAQAAGEDLHEELREEFQAIYDEWQQGGLNQTVIEIEDEINHEQSAYDALKLLNPGAMKTYEDVTAKLKDLSNSMETNHAKLEKANRDIEETHNKWVPRLEQLVLAISVKFSEGLRNIGCAGEVGISKDEDYDNWGIEIRVKFRDHEKLQVLTGQRQSGGERAVSTILYLMSLQKLARSPFRVVDEINQGMDPRNERMIHEQIVKTATAAGTSQYFLITPKLLPDLYYNERMHVLCVHNGEWLPKRLKSVDDYLRRAANGITA